MRLATLLSSVVGILLSANVMASDAVIGSLHITDATVVPTRPGQPNGVAFMQIENKGAGADRLVGFSVPAEFAARGELHTMKHENGVMTMREVPGFDIPAGKRLKLEPGGNHLMLIGIKQPLVQGGTMTATLKFEKAGEVRVPLKIKAPGTAPAMPHGQMPHHKH
jgi:periplasmic copper chaperone A